ncbi:MAG: transcriptional regulator [Candidatus Taylorbacteria bacterium]|nr:transcriptional regulator [Candidatus Taylorbacteria bacterium]
MRILVIEDEEKMASFLKISLEAECFAVDITADGEKGIYYGRSNEYDLVILNSTLPEKNGVEICQRLRNYGKTMPILVTSIKNHIAEKIELLNAGADDYLTKPFVLEELLAHMRALLRRKPAIEQEILSFGDIVLDSKKCLVLRKGKNIALTRKEFMLLQYLIQNTETVLSKAKILEHVWDMSINIFSHTIESHILSLRKKLNDQGKTKLIHTIPGRGYKIGLYRN